ncbi:hypothetical protein KA005_80155 [bacterium]|nr:hypothetical protein [bacterium]
MAARYKVHLKDQSGDLVAIFDDYTSLSVSHRINSIDTCNFSIDDDDSRISLFELDGQIEVYRSYPEYGVEWYLEFEGFHRTFTRQVFENGNRFYTSFARGYNDLLNRRIVGYRAGSAYASKSGVGETVMKEFVDENCGPSATDPPRISDGVITNLTIEADLANGANWTGSKAYINILSVCQDIANRSDIDFKMRGNGAAAFIFRVYNEQLGDDRSVVGLDSATGLNGAGNPPVIFSVGRGNMGEPVYSLKRMNEGNFCFVLGEGVQSDRDVVERSDTDAIDDSPWNKKEFSRDARNRSTTAGYESAGDAALEENQAEETFSFKPIQVESTLYGRDYFFGDIITGRYQDVEKNKKLVGMNILVSDQGEDSPESISVTMGDVLP